MLDRYLFFSVVLWMSVSGIFGQDAVKKSINKMRHHELLVKPKSFVEVSFKNNEEIPSVDRKKLEIKGGLITPIGLFVVGYGNVVGDENIYRFPIIPISPTTFYEYGFQKYKGNQFLLGFGLDTDEAKQNSILDEHRFVFKIGGIYFKNTSEEWSDVGSGKMNQLRFLSSFKYVRKAGLLEGFSYEATFKRFNKDESLQYDLFSPSNNIRIGYTDSSKIRAYRLNHLLEVPVSSQTYVSGGFNIFSAWSSHDFESPSEDQAINDIYNEVFPFPDFSFSSVEYEASVGLRHNFHWGSLSGRLGSSVGSYYGGATKIDLDETSSFKIDLNARFFGEELEDDIIVGLRLKQHVGDSRERTFESFGSEYGGFPVGVGKESLDKIFVSVYFENSNWSASLEYSEIDSRTTVVSAPIPILQEGLNQWEQYGVKAEIRCRLLEHYEFFVNGYVGRGESHQNKLAMLAQQSGDPIENETFSLISFGFGVKRSF